MIIVWYLNVLLAWSTWCCQYVLRGCLQVLQASTAQQQRQDKAAKVYCSVRGASCSLYRKAQTAEQQSDGSCQMSLTVRELHLGDRAWRTWMLTRIIVRTATQLMVLQQTCIYSCMFCSSSWVYHQHSVEILHNLYQTTEFGTSRHSIAGFGFKRLMEVLEAKQLRLGEVA